MSRTKLNNASRIVLSAGTIFLLEVGWLQQQYLSLGWKDALDEPFLEYGVLGLVMAFLLFVPRRLLLWTCPFVLAVSQFLGFVDVAYFRFFGDLPSLHLLPTWLQVDEAGQSLSSVLVWKDLSFVLPLLLYCGLLFFCLRVGSDLLPFKRAAAVLFATSTLFIVWTFANFQDVRYEQLQRRFHNKAVGQLFGLPVYHLYDVYEWTRVQLGAEGGRELDTELVQEVLAFSRELSTEETPFKDRYQGRDFLFLQLESLSYFTVESKYKERPVMPFLEQAKDRVFYFRLFDQTHLGRSADGQFIFLNSLHPPAYRPLPFVFPNNHFEALPKLFVERGYTSFYFEPGNPIFWNSKILAKNYGFERLLFRDELPAEDRKKDIRGWGLTDEALFRKVKKFVDETEEPFFMYVVTMMCHHPYSESSNVPVDFPPKKKEMMLRRYLRCAAARDATLEKFFLQMAETERGRKTVVCLAGDHDANLPRAEMKRADFPLFPEREAVPVLIGSVEEFLGLESASAIPERPRSFGGQMDLAPTIGHVFSLNMEESVFVGWNLLSTQNRGPHFCRLGTWMDQTGRIQEIESSGDWQNDRLFKVSEMLLQGDKIGVFRDFRP